MSRGVKQIARVMAAPRVFPDLEMGRTSLAEDHLRDFVSGAWEVLEPHTFFLPNWHLDVMCEYLMAVSAGQIRRLIINIPPRYMKSLLVSVMWPAWTWIAHPSSRWMFASYSFGLSVEHSLKRRTVIQSSWYQTRWGRRYRLADDQNVKSEFMNTAQGVMVALSVGGGTGAGKGADVIVVDDPVNPREAYSETSREAANIYFDQTLSTRLNNKHTGAIVVVMQRLHEQDLTGHLLRQGGYEQLCLPVEAERRTAVAFPLSGMVHVREEGDVLWPVREGPSQLAEMKVTLGESGYAGQYQQRPSPAGGGIIKEAWLKWYTEVPPRFDFVVATWDMAFKDTRDSSYVAGQVWGVCGARRYLLARVRRRMSFPVTVQAVLQLHQEWPTALPILVEDKANGPAVISTLVDKVPGLIAVNPHGDKVSRAHAVAPYIEAGNVWLPAPAIAPWVLEYVRELTVFPNAANNDEVDATTQFLEYTKQWATMATDLLIGASVVPSVAATMPIVASYAPGRDREGERGSGGIAAELSW